MSEFVIALVLMMGFTPDRVPKKYLHRAEVAAPLIEAAISAEGGDKMLLSAVLVDESGLIPNAVGPGGEFGYGQILEGGSTAAACTDLDWRHKPGENIRCAARRLVKLADICKSTDGDPARFVALYNGHERCLKPQHARAMNGYTRRVLGIMAKACTKPSSVGGADGGPIPLLTPPSTP